METVGDSLIGNILKIRSNWSSTDMNEINIASRATNCQYASSSHLLDVSTIFGEITSCSETNIDV
jgi:hypothetical protein